MIASLFHKGSGIGNQLHRYVMAKVLALDKGYEFSMVAPELFKGKDFMKLDMSNIKSFDSKKYNYYVQPHTGKVVVSDSRELGLKEWNEWDKHCYDPDINFVEDNTIIDGNFEDERYFEHRLPEIAEWLKIEPMDVPDDLCIIGFRGGEYYTVPELGLPTEYFERAIIKILERNPKMRFQVHTDDIERANLLFPGLEIIRDISLNWRVMRYAKYAIIANSSFYVLPRLLKHTDEETVTIAPRYWNRYNIKKWEYPQGYYKKFTYI